MSTEDYSVASLKRVNYQEGHQLTLMCRLTAPVWVNQPGVHTSVQVLGQFGRAGTLLLSGCLVALPLAEFPFLSSSPYILYASKHQRCGFTLRSACL